MSSSPEASLLVRHLLSLTLSSPSTLSPLLTSPTTLFLSPLSPPLSLSPLSLPPPPPPLLSPSLFPFYSLSTSLSSFLLLFSLSLQFPLLLSLSHFTSIEIWGGIRILHFMLFGFMMLQVMMFVTWLWIPTTRSSTLYGEWGDWEKLPSNTPLELRVMPTSHTHTHTHTHTQKAFTVLYK